MQVTDAPEIHSNGFHIKFDVTEGQISFVMPTIVPLCDINLFTNMVSLDTTDQGNTHQYNTCIVLPLKSKSTETSAAENNGYGIPQRMDFSKQFYVVFQVQVQGMTVIFFPVCGFSMCYSLLICYSLGSAAVFGSVRLQ